MHILERVGAVAPFVEKALGWRFGRSYYRGEQIFRLEMPQPPGEKYLPMYNLQQQYIEKFLHDAVAASDLIDMRWQSELTGLERHVDGVSARISSPEGNYYLDALYLLAADGARSPIRSMLGLRLKGDNYEGRYVIADIRMNHDFPTERRAFFEPSGNPGGTVLIHKQPDDIWRGTTSCPKARARPRPSERKISGRASARSSPISATQNRGNWNGGASIPPTPSASTTTGTTACSLSAMPHTSCRFSACAD
jgi:3-(3-hydroxy-phenyl)propionate hydroxylase